MYKIPILLLFLLPTALLAEDIDLEQLLDTYAIESDLSKKTKLENSGNRIIFTRHDLERMQARNLKDILKSYPMISYKESRYAFPDMLFPGGTLPFSSGSVRIFIDEQELTNALYGSGFEYLGDIDLNFIDHIEIYGLTPTFEYSTEPTTLLIKLYSKVAQRDMGGKFQQSRGSMGYNAQSLYYTEEFEKFSYFAYASRYEDIRDTYKNPYVDNPQKISRNQERYHIFAKIYTNDSSFQVQALKNRKDMFIGMSPFGTPKQSFNDDTVVHVGYSNKSLENLNFAISYDEGESTQTYEDAYYLFPAGDGKNVIDYFDITMLSRVFTSHLRYKYAIDNNNLVVGAKYRFKNFDFLTTNMRIKGTQDKIATPAPDYSSQAIVNLFFEDGYNFANNSLLTLGAQYSHVQNDANIASQDLRFARLGYTYTTHDWAFNTTLFAQELPVEPYMYNPLFNQDNVNEIKPQKMQGGMIDVKYQDSINEVRYFSFATYINDMIAQDKVGKIVNFDNRVLSFGTYLDYTLHLDINNKIIFNINYALLDNLPNEKKSTIKTYGGYIRMLNSYEDWDFFSEAVYNRDNNLKESFVDLSLGIKYQFAINLSLNVKGENILGRAPQQVYYMASPQAPNDSSYYSSLRAATIQQRFIVTADYLF